MKKIACIVMMSLFWLSVHGQDVFEAINYPFSVHKVKLSNGQTMAYMDEGKGDVLIFIHGLGSYGPAWQKNIEELREKYRCIVVDLVGYGRSSKPEDTFLLTDQAAFIEELSEKLSIPDFHVVGHSMGGQIAVHLGYNFPEKVKSLILIAPAGIETFTDQQKAFFEMITPAAIAASSDQEIASNLHKNFATFPSDAQFMIDDRILIKEDPEFDLYTATVVNGIRGMVRQPVSDFLGDLKMPTLVLFGVQDNLIPNKLLNPHLSTQSIAETASKLIPNVSVKLIPNAGHMLMFEQANEVNRFMEEFLNK